MREPIQATMRFGATASQPMQAVALIYDLEGFSRFVNQPDVLHYAPIFLNHVSAAMNVVLFGGAAPIWARKAPSVIDPLPSPVHEKFLGDGMLYIWTLEQSIADAQRTFVIRLLNRLWHVKNDFDRIVQATLETVPIADVPKRIRFGLAQGTVHAIATEAGTTEYIGFCINLASRLQSYCPDLGFIASARLLVSDAQRIDEEYERVMATKIRGFPREIVIVDAKEYRALDGATKAQLFEPLGS